LETSENGKLQSLLDSIDGLFTVAGLLFFRMRAAAGGDMFVLLMRQRQWGG
jgi:hypothetical protein